MMSFCINRAAQPTIYNYHKRLKRYLHEAMKFGLLDADPYVGLHFERGKFEKRKYLTEEELEIIRSCKINMPSIERVRDLFLFQCFTGLAYADFEKFVLRKMLKREMENLSLRIDGRKQMRIIR